MKISALTNSILAFIFLIVGFSFTIHFSMDTINNKNVLAIQELKNEYTYVGKSERSDYYYFKDSNNIVKENYINPKLNLEFKINENVTVYQTFYDYDNSNFIYQWMYNKILIENEFGNYDTITFEYPSQLIGE